MAWASSLVKNEAIPPTRSSLTPKALELYREKGIPILESTEEEMLASLWLLSLRQTEGALDFETRVVELWCEREKVETLEVIELISAMTHGAQSSMMQKRQKIGKNP